MSAQDQLGHLLGVALSLVGGVLLLVWLVGTRARGPHCPRCDFDLAGHERPSRCPECGFSSTAPGAWHRRQRRRGLVWIAGAAFVLAYVASVARRTVQRGLWGAVPTPAVALATLWDDPDRPTMIDGVAGPGPPTCWREEMQSRLQNGELAGWKGRLWLWRTSLAHPPRNAATDPDEEGFEAIALPSRAAPGEVLAFVEFAVNPADWTANGGTIGRTVCVGGRLGVHHRAREREQVARLLGAIGSKQSGPVFVPELGGPPAATLGATRDLASRAISTRWEPGTDAAPRREWIARAAAALAAEPDVSAGSRSEAARAFLAAPVRAGEQKTVADTLDAVMPAAPDAGPGWTIRAGVLCAADGALYDESRYFAIWNYRDLPGCAGARTAREAIERIQRSNPAWWPEFGGDQCVAWKVGERVVVLASPAQHARMEAGGESANR